MGANKIAAFVESFLEGDLIPALLWQAGSQIFSSTVHIGSVPGRLGARRLRRRCCIKSFFDGVIPTTAEGRRQDS
jgi:hypothetical protein